MSDKRETKNPKEPEIPDEVLNLHPIALQVVEVLTSPGPNGEKFDLSDDLLTDLHAGVLEYEGDELGHVAHTLSAFIFAMKEEQNSPTLANKVMSVLQAQDIHAKLKALSISADPEEIQQIASRFSSFSGMGAKTAPKVDDPKPEGTIGLDKLNFPRRL